MTVIPASLTHDPWPEAARATQAAGDGEDAESALRECVHAALRITGDVTAQERPGALKTGERQFHVGGVFLADPDKDAHLLVAEWGFPPEQYRLSFPRDTGHPGRVWQNRQPLILANTDEHGDFKQILKTARMGSSMYAPLLWRGTFLGQMIVAAQARNTYAQPDLERVTALAAVAAGLYMAKDGPDWLDRLWQSKAKDRSE
jgi:signal transduction protein with GAF and PtsI domain